MQSMASVADESSVACFCFRFWGTIVVAVMLAGMVKVPVGGRLGMPTRAVVLPLSTSIAVRAFVGLGQTEFSSRMW